MSYVKEQVMTVKDVAQYLNVDEKTIYRLLKRGEMPAFKVLGSWRFEFADLRSWVAEQKKISSAGKGNKQKDTRC